MAELERNATIEKKKREEASTGKIQAGHSDKVGGSTNQTTDGGEKNGNSSSALAKGERIVFFTTEYKYEYIRFKNKN